MGVIQQSFNQALSVAGLANQLRQQNPNYQKKQEEKDFAKSTKKYYESKASITKALEETPAGYAGHKELKDAQKQLEDRRTDELLARGKYKEWAQRKSGQWGRIANMNQYDERIAEIANDRAENIARQVSKQSQNEKEIVRQLRGLLPLSQELVARHNARRGLNESK